MKIAKMSKQEGTTVPAPFKRTIKPIFGPDEERGGIKEISCSQVFLYPGSQTDYHIDEKPELMYVVKGRGVAICDGQETEIETDDVMWVPAGERHQLKNPGNTMMKLLTAYVPGRSHKEGIQRRLAAAAAAQNEKK